MKSKKKYIFLITLLLLSVSIFLTGCFDNKEENVGLFDDVDVEDGQGGEVKEGDVDEEDDEIKNNGLNVDFAGGKSFYIDQLDERAHKAFLEVRNAVTNGVKEVTLETIVTDKDIERIMNILLLDSPEAIGLSNNYSYIPDNAGNIIKLRLNYFISADRIKEIQKERTMHLSDIQSKFTDDTTPKSEAANVLLSNEDNTPYRQELTSKTISTNVLAGPGSKDNLMSSILSGKRTVGEAREVFAESLADDLDLHIDSINGISKNPFDENVVERPKDIDYLSHKAVLNSDVYGSDVIPLTKLKRKVDMLRAVGIDASVVGGEFVATDLIPKNVFLDPFKYIDYNKLTKKVDEDNVVHVSLDPYNYYFWVIMDLGDAYYIYDPVVGRFVNHYIENTLVNENDPSKSSDMFYPQGLKKHVDESLFYIAPDELLSSSRIMYVNENLLGMPHACTSYRNATANDNNSFVSSFGLSELRSEVIEFSDKIVKEAETGDVFVKVMKNEDSLDEFIKIFNGYFDDYNEENKNAVKEYKVKKIPAVNAFVLYSILK